MQLTETGKKYMRRFFIISGILIGFILGNLSNEFLSRPETKIENEYGKIKNKGTGTQNVEQNPTNDQSKKTWKFWKKDKSKKGAS